MYLQNDFKIIQNQISKHDDTQLGVSLRAAQIFLKL